jgi:hypothetical protein
VLFLAIPDIKPAQEDTQHTERRVVHAWQQQQQVEADHMTPRLSAPTMRWGSSVVIIALLFCSLCVIGVAASQQEQSVCPEQWSTAVLSVGRGFLAATSLPNQGLAIFAGGLDGL